jgi:hypothetical protein
MRTGNRLTLNLSFQALALQDCIHKKPTHYHNLKGEFRLLGPWATVLNT